MPQGLAEKPKYLPKPPNAVTEEKGSKSNSSNSNSKSKNAIPESAEPA